MTMIRPLRNSLIILIALLQLVAPLVHAHSSGMQGASGGVHLPGLEFINGDKFKAGLHAEASRSDYCGMAIGVSCGVQHAKASLGLITAAIDSHPRLEIHGSDFLVATISFSPQQPTGTIPLTVLQPISPRAPPYLPEAA